MTDSVLSMPERPVTIKPNENGRTQHILQQITDYAKQNQLQLFNNQSTISVFGTPKFSKYSSSKPDIVVIGRDKSTIATAHVYDSNGDEEEVDEMTKKFDLATLIAETKLDTGLNDRVLGQMLAGMDKTLGDLFHMSIVNGSVLTNLTMYGLCLRHEADVFKANVVFGKQTVLYQGNKELGVSDAVNRVFYQLITT